MDIRGKVHNPENRKLAQELRRLCGRTNLLHFSDASRLQAPVRSNTTGNAIVESDLLSETVSDVWGLYDALPLLVFEIRSILCKGRREVADNHKCRLR